MHFFSKFRLTVTLERRNASLRFQTCVLGLYCEFRIFWIHLDSISDSIYLQELFIALITHSLIFPILAYKTILLAYIIYSHLVSHVGLYFCTVVILITIPCILFSLNLSFFSMADQNYVCQFKSTLGGSCTGPSMPPLFHEDTFHMSQSHTCDHLDINQQVHNPLSDLPEGPNLLHASASTVN